MANLVKRATEIDEKLPPLPKYEAEVIVDGSIITFRIDADKLAAMAVEREGEKEQNGKIVKYTKNPAVMLTGLAKGVQVLQTNPADGMDYLLEVDVALGGGGNGVYMPITRSKLIGMVKPEVQS